MRRNKWNDQERAASCIRARIIWALVGEGSVSSFPSPSAWAGVWATWDGFDSLSTLAGIVASSGPIGIVVEWFGSELEKFNPDGSECASDCSGWCPHQIKSWYGHCSRAFAGSPRLHRDIIHKGFSVRRNRGNSIIFFSRACLCNLRMQGAKIFAKSAKNLLKFDPSADISKT